MYYLNKAIYLCAVIELVSSYIKQYNRINDKDIFGIDNDYNMIVQ